jgi:hypothetical protein
LWIKRRVSINASRVGRDSFFGCAIRFQFGTHRNITSSSAAAQLNDFDKTGSIVHEYNQTCKAVGLNIPQNYF